MSPNLTVFARALALANLTTAAGLKLAIGKTGAVEVLGGMTPEVSQALAALTMWQPDASWTAEEAKAQRERMRGGPGYRALRLMAAAESLAARECLTLPVGDFAGLPVPFTLTFRARGLLWACVTTRSGHEAAEKAGHLVFVVRELEAAALAVQLNRARAHDLGDWLDHKRRGQWVLTHERARVAELPEYRDGMRPRIELGEVCDALGAELLRVELHERKGA